MTTTDLIIFAVVIIVCYSLAKLISRKIAQHLARKRKEKYTVATIVHPQSGTADADEFLDDDAD